MCIRVESPPPPSPQGFSQESEKGSEREKLSLCNKRSASLGGRYWKGWGKGSEMVFNLVFVCVCVFFFFLLEFLFLFLKKGGEVHVTSFHAYCVSK